MKIVVLSSRENFVWHSMQEIIPFLEKTWLHLVDNKTQVEILNVDQIAAGDLMRSVLGAEQIVLTCFNLKICKVAYYIRDHLKLDVNFVIHVHNMATIAFWPFRRYGNIHPFRKNDLFITSCTNDEKTLKAVFKEVQILKIPFFIPESPTQLLNKNFSSVEKVVYIGRISPQKNLHNLILAYGISKKRMNSALPQLVFFGKEDHLGSPNMAIKENDYSGFLKNLVEKLQLRDAVHFYGQAERASLNHYLSEHRCLTVSPSLHSDENFGMAILQSLLLGNQALISDWGGHSDFKKTFFERVTLMPVTNTSFGPSLSAEVIVQQLEHLLLNRPLRSPISVDTSYDLNRQASLIRDHLKSYSSDNLEFSELGENIFKRSEKFSQTDKNNTQIFTDFSDPLFHEISSYYIGQVNRRQSADRRFPYPAPWAKLNKSDELQINDPHKGSFKIKYAADSQDLFNSGYLVTEDLSS
ncbi:MAG: glycosyltransferase [Pseudobdellovibrio sp.]